jgi:drug/metabolite transporter (DMT)-like permease
MSALQLMVLSAYAFGMSAGQMLFKLAALSFSPFGTTPLSLAGRLFQLVANPYFIAAMSLYFSLSVLWVWILTFTPLSRAYPFVALAFVLTPLLSHFVFMETLSLPFYFGVCFIVVGLILVIC